MKSFLWFVSVTLVLAAMTGFVFLTDADLFDLFNGSSYQQRSRWKRSQLYPQYVLPPDQDRQRYYQEEEDRHHHTGHQHPKASDNENSLKSRIPSPDKFEEFWSNENYAQLMPRPTPFPPNHFINQPYFEVKPSKTVANSMATYKRQQVNTERPMASSNHKVSREVQHNVEPTTSTKRTPFTNNLSAATAVATINEQNFNDLDVVLKASESKSKPSFTKMFQKAISHRRIGKPKKSIKEQIDKKKLKQEIPQQRDYRHGGGGYGHGGGTTYHHAQPPVYYIPNHHKEKDFSGLLKLFLLAILIPLGICIALAVAAAFVTGLSTYGRYLVTYVNSTNSTYYLINGLGGFANLFGGFGGISGLIGGATSASAATVAVAQQQQQQQSSNNNNNNNNVNDNNNNNNIAVIVVNITGRANKGNGFLRKSFKLKSIPIEQLEEEEDEDEDIGRVVENI